MTDILTARRIVQWQEARHAGLLDGTLLWQEEYPGAFTHCADPRRAAVEQAWAEVEEARQDLAALTEQVG